LGGDENKGAVGVTSYPRKRVSCARKVATSARWKSVSEKATNSVAEGNCVAVKRGGEQPEANCRSVG